MSVSGRGGGVSVDALVALAAVLAILVAVGAAAAAHAGGARELGVRTTAQRLLVDRAQRLASLTLDSFPPSGLYGPDSATPRLAELLAPVGPVAFRLHVAPAPAGPDGVTVAQLRLTASWGTDETDVVLVRGLRPVTEVGP